MFLGMCFWGGFSNRHFLMRWRVSSHRRICGEKKNIQFFFLMLWSLCQGACVDRKHMSGKNRGRKKKEKRLELASIRKLLPSVNVTVSLQILLNMAYTTVFPHSVRSGLTREMNAYCSSGKKTLLKIRTSLTINKRNEAISPENRIPWFSVA